MPRICDVSGWNPGPVKASASFSIDTNGTWISPYVCRIRPLVTNVLHVLGANMQIQVGNWIQKVNGETVKCVGPGTVVSYMMGQSVIYPWNIDGFSMPRTMTGSFVLVSALTSPRKLLSLCFAKSQ